MSWGKPAGWMAYTSVDSIVFLMFSRYSGRMFAHAIFFGEDSFLCVVCSMDGAEMLLDVHGAAGHRCGGAGH